MKIIAACIALALSSCALSVVSPKTGIRYTITAEAPVSVAPAK